MQGHDRVVLMPGELSSKIAPINHGGNSITKDVISPNPSMTNASSSVGHNRSNSNPNPSKLSTTSQEHLSSGIPLVRSRTAPQGHSIPSKPEVTPLRERSKSGSVTDANPSYPNNSNSNAIDLVWQQSLPGPPHQPPQETSDPDSEEQALFEQRLCEDIYGVAVRKINHNGKSNLRYVKCLYVDASEVLHTDEPTSNGPQHHYSSSKSVSSRHSRGSRKGLSRFLGGSNHRTSGNGYSAVDVDQRGLLQEVESTTEHIFTSGSANNNTPSKYTGKVRVLSWGKKKDVTVPLDKFTAVKKGKVNYRSMRNPCDSSRIVSLVTSDVYTDNKNNSVSLDIEAPTRLDRDKFAKAFARFLNIPLIEEGDIIRQSNAVSTAIPQQQYNQPSPASQHPTGVDSNRSVARSIKSDMTPQSWKDNHRLSAASSVGNDASMPDIALTASASITTNERGGNNPRTSSWKQLNAPLPVVTTRGKTVSSPAGKNGAIAKPPLINRRSASGGGVNAPPFYPVTSSNINTHSTSKIHSNNSTANNNNNNSAGTSNINNSSTNGGSSRNGSDVDDPPLASLPSSTLSRGASKTNSTGVVLSTTNNNLNNTVTTSSSHNKGKMVLEIPITTKSKLSKNSNSNHATGTPATSAISAHMHTQSTTPDTPAIDHIADSQNINPNDISRDTDITDENDASIVSSITGVGFDQDLVEELHLALERMKVELEESRAEASRAVKVAEQAIQSAENSNSKDWNNTVTHKAAEAAATAQKKSAEAMAKARVAEERLELERKNAILRTKHVEKAEQQASHWQTRAAAAEVQRHAVAEALESERRKNQELMLQTERTEAVAANKLKDAFDPFGATGKPVLLSPRAPMDSSEIDRLRSKLAMESARRRKLLDELQDLRGAVRVYCRLKEPSKPAEADEDPPIVDMVSNEVLMVHRNLSTTYQKQQQKALSNKNGVSTKPSPSTPLCFEFDGILASDMGQQDVYAEFEAICASVVEGFRICIMSYGQANAGKTHTMLGDVAVDQKDHTVSIQNEGIHLRAMQQLFSLLEHRKDRFLETVTMNLVEVHDEKLTDLLAGTEFAEKNGRVEVRKSTRRSEDQNTPGRKTSELPCKLEIKTNRDGETVVRGVLSVDITSYDDVLRVWKESLSRRSSRLTDQKVEDLRAYERESHIVATLRVNSKNLSTGSTASGRMQFVDFASSDITSKRPLGSSGGVSSFLSKKLMSSGSFPGQLLDDWKFTNKSLNTVREVVLARGQYQRSVPYRNSTITHILSDSLEADTKVVFIACISSDEQDIPNTACTLKLADEMRKVVVGKATRHTTVDPLHGLRKSSLITSATT